MIDYTVIGGNGFIGSEIVKQLKEKKYTVFIPEKDDASIFTSDLGTVIYCAGYGECKKNPSKVLQSNTVLLSKILDNAYFEKLVYISSNRVYMGQNETSEKSNISILEADSRRLFNLTKLVSEELCLLSDRNIVIARPSNVYGLALNSPLFLPAITRNAINNGVVDMYVSPKYEKDYVSVVDVASAICKLAEKRNLTGKIFNVASGYNTTAAKIAEVLTLETKCKINWHSEIQDECFPVNDISTLQNEIEYKPNDVLIDLKKMIHDFELLLKQDASKC